MSWRKSGALRYGFIAVAALAADITFSAGAQVISVLNPDATLTSEGTRVGLPFQRPVFQRGIRTYGLLEQNEPGTEPTSFGASPQVITVSVPSANVSAGAVSFSANPQVVTVVHDGTLTSPGVSLPLVYQRPVFQRGIRAYGPPAVSTTSEAPAAPGAPVDPWLLKPRFVQSVRQVAPQRPYAEVYGAILSKADILFIAPAQTITVSAPTGTLTGIGAGSYPIPYQRPVFQRGIRHYGPTVQPAASAAQGLTATAQVIAVRIPAATLTTGASTLTAQAQVIVVSVPSAALATVNPPDHAPFKRIRGVVKATRVYHRTSQVRRIERPQISVPTNDQGLTATAQVIAVRIPTATLTTGASTLTAVRQVVCVSAPTAGLSRAVTATPQVIAVRLATAALSVGTSNLPASTQVVAVRIPTASLTGAAQLPSTIFDATVESRLATYTLESRLRNTTTSRALVYTVEVTHL